MSTPVLHVLAGPNGAGKSTLVHVALQPTTHLPFINADEIAAERWPGRESEHAYDASAAAMAEREFALAGRRSFITETVFSHPSKLELLRRAVASGYLVTLHVILVPEEMSVRRVTLRVRQGGHSVPEAKIRERYQRLWGLIAQARSVAQTTVFYDNSRASAPFEEVARYQSGRLVAAAAWPTWTPAALTA